MHWLSWKALTVFLASGNRPSFQQRRRQRQSSRIGDSELPFEQSSTAAYDDDNSASVLERGAADVTYEVCLSPGCIADGSEKTLDQLQALAPPNVIIKSGDCCSLCGNGPVVTTTTNDAAASSIRSTNTKKHHRKVSGAKVLELLYPEQHDIIDDGPSRKLIKGYEIVLQAEDAFHGKDYDKAIDLYEQALALCFHPAMDLQAARDHFWNHHDDSHKRTKIITTTPIGLDWLVRARRHEAEARLMRGNNDDVEGALFAAQASCNISRNTCPESFRVLADVYRRKGNDGGELEALKSMLALSVDNDNQDCSVPFAIQNQRREAGFRIAKLERDLAKTKK